jgi:2-dehydro-3-deoxygluconokinase
MPRIVTFGEIMMRLSPPGKKRIVQADSLDILFSGAEANVGGALAQWGVNATHVTRFPDHELGHAATSYWKKLGVDMQSVLYGPERLGLYFVENGAMARATQIVYDRLPSAFSCVQPGMFDWDFILDKADWFHWTGITPALSQGAADCLLEALIIAEKKKITVSADINYRSNLWRYGKKPGEVMDRLVSKSQVVVASENDTSKIFGITERKTNGESVFISISKQMMERFPSIRYLVSSERENISACHNRLSGQLWNGKEFFQTREYDLDNIIERIGSGDAFIAGFIYGCFENWSDQQKIDFAAASATIKHSIEGDINIAGLDEVVGVMQGKSGGQIKR